MHFKLCLDIIQRIYDKKKSAEMASQDANSLQDVYFSQNNNNNNNNNEISAMFHFLGRGEGVLTCQIYIQSECMV